MENHIITIKSIIATMIREEIEPHLDWCVGPSGDGYAVVSADDLQGLIKGLSVIKEELRELESFFGGV